MTRRNRFPFILPTKPNQSTPKFITMSDAQAAPVTENGVPSVAQDKVEEAPGHKVCYYCSLVGVPWPHPASQVFVGNLAYATTDEGLKALFAPFASDMYVAMHSPMHLFH